MQAAAAVSDLWDDEGHRISQLLFGEAFDLLDRQGDRVWGQSRRDGVVGWTAASALIEAGGTPSHRVASMGGALPFNALVDPARDAVGDSALAPLGEFEPGLADVAERLLGTPHALGGRSDRETDCAGLVQTCLIACGRAAPRWSDGQAEIGRAVGLADMRRGDLVVWPHSTGGPGWSGHSAVIASPGALIHASGRAGSVVIEALSDVDARQRAEGFGAPIFRRV
ncbi:MAG: C40 family peptidase [Caulobacteraceae bacterium]|nr:C40 family peptidase [Caulobacteraceae bacterium]